MSMYYHGGHMVDEDSVYIFSTMAAEQEIGHTIISYQKDDQETELSLLEWKSVGWGSFDGKLMILGENGEIAFFDQGKEINQTVIGSDDVYRGLTIKNNNLLAYGMLTCLKASWDGNNWKDDNLGIDKKNYGILDINCNQDGLCICVCWDGDIYQRLGNGKWDDISSPVNTILSSVLVCEDGSFFSCGKNGNIVQGKDDECSVFEHAFKELDFWDVFELEGEVFFASTTAIFKLVDDKLSPVLGWPLSENGVYASYMKTPGGFWIITEKVLYSYVKGVFREVH